MLNGCRVVFPARRVHAKARTQTPVVPRTLLAAPGRFTMMDASLQKARNLESSRSMAPLKRFLFCFEVFYANC